MSQELPPSERPSEPSRPSWEDEKEREKEQEKEQEKEREKEPEKEGHAGEKFQRDPVSAAFWAGILILAGLILMADNLHYLPQIGHAQVWNWIAFGAGLAVLLEGVMRAVSPDYARPVTGRFIMGGVLIVIGLSGIVSAEITWPLLLVVVGLGLLITNLMRRR
jgi:cation transport ATPase